MDRNNSTTHPLSYNCRDCEDITGKFTNKENLETMGISDFFSCTPIQIRYTEKSGLKSAANDFIFPMRIEIRR